MVLTLDETVVKFEAFAKKVIEENKENKFISVSCDEALIKLMQISSQYRKALQMQWILINKLMISSIINDYPDWKPNEETIKVPDGLFIKGNSEYATYLTRLTPFDLNKELFTTVESIYYFAFSFKKWCNEIPGLKQFSSPGIRDVRNHIMEHPKFKYTEQFIVSKEKGAILKSAKYVLNETTGEFEEESVSVDNGLEANIREFKEILENLINLRIVGK